MCFSFEHRFNVSVSTGRAVSINASDRRGADLQDHAYLICRAVFVKECDDRHPFCKQNHFCGRKEFTQETPKIFRARLGNEGIQKLGVDLLLYWFCEGVF